MSSLNEDDSHRLSIIDFIEDLFVFLAHYQDFAETEWTEDCGLILVDDLEFALSTIPELSLFEQKLIQKAGIVQVTRVMKNSRKKVEDPGFFKHIHKKLLRISEKLRQAVIDNNDILVIESTSFSSDLADKRTSSQKFRRSNSVWTVKKR